MIREATRADAAALAGVQYRAWWRAYAEFVDTDHFGTLEERVARWHEILAQPTELRRTTIVFDQDRRLAGFASISPARDGDLGPEVGEVMRLYVDPPAQGAGVGGALLTAAEARLRADAFGIAVLWVMAQNEHARHVYERRGWALEGGAAREDLWAPEVRYRRTL